jgi:RimJ/RimL family protein N-acetyltransferase
MTIRRLTPEDAAAFQSLRLAGLLAEPAAFGSSHAEEVGQPLEAVAQRLSPQLDRGVFGAFQADRLVGLAALGREGMHKISHKGLLWGMYVAPAARRQGHARALVQAVLGLAREVPGMRQVNLCVNARNAPAIALYAAAGFVCFGLEREALCVDGNWHDEMLMVWRQPAQV